MRTKLVLAALALSTAACGSASTEDDTPERTDPPVTETIAASTVEDVSPVGGSVVARRRAEIATRMMARVGELRVDIGDRVDSGQTLLLLGTEDIVASRAKAEAGAEVARAAWDEATRHVARMDTLYRLDVVPLVQRDQARLALAQAEAHLNVARATLREAGIAADYARISAPFAGVVVERRVDPGDMALPGLPLLVIESAGPRDAVLAVPVELASTLEIGDSLHVTRRAGPATSGVVRVISGGADPGSRTVEVRVTVPEDWPTGASVTGLVPSGSRVVVTVPMHAVVRRGQLTGVRIASEAAESIRWVRLGRVVGDRVEVLSGLEAGERIVP